jgi:hypothetical protein
MIKTAATTIPMTMFVAYGLIPFGLAHLLSTHTFPSVHSVFVLQTAFVNDDRVALG